MIHFGICLRYSFRIRAAAAALPRFFSSFFCFLLFLFLLFLPAAETPCFHVKLRFAFCVCFFFLLLFPLTHTYTDIVFFVVFLMRLPSSLSFSSLFFVLFRVFVCGWVCIVFLFDFFLYYSRFFLLLIYV